MKKNRLFRTSHGMSKRQVFQLVLTTILILFGTNRSIFAAAAFANCCLILAFEKEFFVFRFLFYIMPMAGIFKLDPEGTSLFTYFELLFIIKHIFKKKLRITYGEIITLFLGAYIVITGSLYPPFNVTRTVKILMNLLLIGYIAELNPEWAHKQLFLYYIFGIIVSSLMRFADSPFFRISEYVAAQSEHFAGMTTVRFAGLYGDPNYYSVNVIIAICLLIVLYRRRELSFSTATGLMVPLVIFVGLTGSKSSFLMLLLVFFLLMYVCIKNRNYIALLGCFFGIAFIIMLVGQGSIQIFDYVLHRLKNSTSGMDTFSSSRTRIWRSFFQFFSENPGRTIFGTGASIITLDNTAAHNTYIDLIFMLGIVGTVLYILALYYNMRKQKRRIRRNLVNYSVFLVIGVMYAFLSELLYFDPPFHIALAGMVWNLENGKTQFNFNIRESP